MCKQTYQQTWCGLGEHQVGDLVSTAQLTCSEARDIGFGKCGKIITADKPTVIHTNCSHCRKLEREGRLPPPPRTPLSPTFTRSCAHPPFPRPDSRQSIYSERAVSRASSRNSCRSVGGFAGQSGIPAPTFGRNSARKVLPRSSSVMVPNGLRERSFSRSSATAAPAQTPTADRSFSRASSPPESGLKALPERYLSPEPEEASHEE
ncbi:hypothetical protein F4778DRAFT_715114 [Xylariomycetidae sp. FL2044]|nr:hypothetical protein F4778DRAFT_715114 [Xylariomycetidae sp. FL2044]